MERPLELAKGTGAGMRGVRLHGLGSVLCGACAALFLTATIAAWPGIAHADEPTGLAAAAALEDVLVAAIARSEKSVVSIARVVDKGNGLADVQPNFFMGRQGMAGQQGPNDPEFVPTSFATGIVVGKGLV